MANLEREGFREILPTLKVSDLRGAKLQIVTIARAPEIVPGFAQGKSKRAEREKLLLMRFKEWPEKVWYPNNTSITRLMKALGKETEAMTGKRIPLKVEETQNPETGRDTEALFIASETEWTEIFNEFDEESNVEKTSRRSRRKTSRR